MGSQLQVLAPAADRDRAVIRPEASRRPCAWRRDWRTPGLALIAVAAALLGPGPAAPAQELEPKLKAEFIERFIRFVEWPPASAPTGRDEPFIIGLAGPTQVEPFLKQVVARLRLKGRRARLVRLRSTEEVANCDVVLIPASSAAQLPQLLAEVADHPILTIGDGEDFGARGVQINFYREGEYLRFEINRRAVERSGLVFSSNLLRLARLIDGDETP